MEAYQYKNSGIEWLGEVPAHWSLQRLFGVCTFVRGNSGFEKNDLLNKGKYIALQYGKTYKVDVVSEEFEFFVNDEFYKKSQVVNQGDVIFVSTSETIEDLGHSVFYNRIDIGLIGGEQILLKPNQNILKGKFLFYSSKVFGKQLRKFATGIKVFRFDTYDLKTVYIPIPPLPEQRAIADYLDRATEKIDRVIAIKERQLELIEGFFHTKLHEVITQGLNGNSFKKGNNAYMDKVPNAWVIDRIKDVCEFNPVKSKANCSNDELVSVYPMEFISEDGKVLGANQLSYEEVDTGLNSFENGDVIFAKITPCMENGKGAYMTEIPTRIAFGSTEFFVLRPTFRVLGKFLYYATRNYKFRQYLEANMKGAAGQQRVPSKFFQFCEIAFPIDKNQQQKIIDFLDDLKLKTDKLIQKTQHQIEILQSYRQSLIHECVTGKKWVVEEYKEETTTEKTH